MNRILVAGLRAGKTKEEIEYSYTQGYKDGWKAAIEFVQGRAKAEDWWLPRDLDSSM